MGARRGRAHRPAAPPRRAYDYAEMAQSYEENPPRRDELVGEPDVAPSAVRQHPPER